MSTPEKPNMIVDYGRIAENNKRIINNNPNILQTNKDILNEFLVTYNVADATKAIFLDYIEHFLEKVDLTKDLDDKTKIRKVFIELKTTYKTNSYMIKIIEASKRLVKWVREGELPTAFKLIVKRDFVDRSTEKRLDVKDMWRQEDLDAVLPHLTTIQLKAILATQVNEGFRPSEFVGLNYGDVTVISKFGFVQFKVRRSKTGKPRVVTCKRCVPIFLRWYYSHPTKKDTDPLWVTERMELSHPNTPNQEKIKRYEYHNMVHRITLAAKKAGVTKPTDFYTLRHSSCSWDRRERIDVPFAARRHGHSIKHFDQTYCKTSDEDEAEIGAQEYGIEIAELKKEPNLTCGFCDYINGSKDTHCFKCNKPLTTQVAQEDIKQEEDRILNMVNKALNAKVTRFEGPTEIMDGDTTLEIGKHVRKVGNDIISLRDEFKDISDAELRQILLQYKLNKKNKK